MTSSEPTLKAAIEALNFNWPTGGRKSNNQIKMKALGGKFDKDSALADRFNRDGSIK